MWTWFNSRYLFNFFRLWSRVVRTRTSQELTRPSSRLDSEGEEDEDDADKVNVNDPFLLKPGRLNLKKSSWYYLLMRWDCDILILFKICKAICKMMYYVKGTPKHWFGKIRKKANSRPEAKKGLGWHQLKKMKTAFSSNKIFMLGFF